MATGTQIEQQINVNYDAIDKIGAEMASSVPMSRQVTLNKELNRLWQAQQYWAQEYHRVTGKSIALFKEVKIAGNPNEEKEQKEAQAKAAKALGDSRRKLEEGIAEIRREQARVTARLQDQYDISVTWQNALFSHWVRMGAGLHPTHPLMVKKAIAERVPALLQDAERLMNAGKLDKAWGKVATAAAKVKWGFDFLNWWMSQLETGARRAEAGIKISAALATLVVSAPLEVGVLGAMALAAAGEGAQQTTLLVAQGATGDQQVTLEDLKKAVLETAIAAGTAGVGKGLANKLAKALGGKVATEILKRTPTKDEIEFVTARIEQYVVANSSSILKKVLKLDTDPDWNLWYMLITPAINPIAVEMSKEKDLRR